MNPLRIDDIYKLARILEGVPVLGCIPGSPSHRCGVHRGDIILHTNGQRVRDLHEYFRARDERADGMTVVVYRDGNELELTMAFGETLTTQQVVEYFEAEGGVIPTWSSMKSTGDPEDVC